MKKLTVLLVVAGTLSMLAGCKEDKPETPAEVVQTVDWYKAHKAERAEVLAKCKANPGELAATPNCVNASRADSSSTWSAKGGGVSPVKPLTADDINKK
nr:entry exclusion protein [uncultured bacterium]BCU00308.1 entry exclusion protein [uncultured bacterium]